MSSKLALDIHNLTVSYGKTPVLWNVDAEIPAGSFVALVGPNGSGKSTLLKTAVGLLKPLSGHVRHFDGLELDACRKRLAYLPQRESVDWDFPIDVIEVVLMGGYARRGLFGRRTDEDVRNAQASLERVGMLPFAKRQIGELSGGQQQRVFLARALMTDADTYLLDEPFAAVDALTEERILQVLRELQAAGKTIVMAHHDLATAMEYTDYALLMNTRLVKFGLTREVLTLENLKKAYGGQLQGLATVLEAIAEQRRLL
jgi:manganese/zinc/iron transport system ATP- binding protein